MPLTKFKSILKQFPWIYPSRIINSCREWIDRQNQKNGIYIGARKHTYELIQPAENHTHQLPLLANGIDIETFSNNLFYQTAPAYLYALKDVYINKQTGLVLSNRNALFQEFTHHFGIEPLNKFILKRPFYTYSGHIKNIDGIGAMLVSPQSQNYYHWLFDVLPRIKLYQPVMGHIGHFCISSAVPQKFLDILPEFGIQTDKILLVNNAEKLHFDSLYVASLPGSEGRSPRWAINFLRSVLIKDCPAQSAPKKIYFKRGQQTERRIWNEDSLIELLQALNFDIIEPDGLSITQQISIVQQAAIIVSAHGAALSNLIFAREGTSVIELFSPDYFRTDCFFTLARMLKLNYRYLQGTKPAGTNWGDIVVNMSQLQAMLIKTG